MNFMAAFIFSLVVWCIHTLGYENAHHTVSQECEKLVAFYVGDVVYKCSKVSKGVNL